jgi:hypothetical protein
MLILDRTSSMSAADMTNVKDASDALLQALDPSLVHVALGTTGPASSTNKCSGSDSGATGIAAASGEANPAWVAAPYPNAAPLSDYLLSDGSLNPASAIVKSIDCLNQSKVQTDLGTPINAAVQYFQTYGRPGAQRDIILMTDGEANQPAGNSPCDYADQQATLAKAAGINIATVGFGVQTATCSSDKTGPFVGVEVPDLLAGMASPANGVPSKADLGCTDAENTDGDNFYCEPKSGDLSAIFVAAAQKLTDSIPRLIK